MSGNISTSINSCEDLLLRNSIRKKAPCFQKEDAKNPTGDLEIAEKRMQEVLGI